MRDTCAPPNDRLAKSAAVLARERHALRDALVDDVYRYLREPVDVGFAGAEIAALDSVVEQAVDAVAVVLIILRGVDSALSCDGMRASRRILETETLYVVSEFGKRRGSRCAGEPRADDKHGVLALIRRVDELQLETGPFPGGFDRTGRNSGI